SVTNMSQVFHGAFSFNQPITSWNVSSVTDMSRMFAYATSFNQPLYSWDTSSLIYMPAMFSGASSFNQPLDTWNVSSVILMHDMFYNASSFNQPLDTWNVSSVTNMTRMLDFAASFDQNLGGWYVVIDSASIDRADVPGAVGTVSAQNAFLDGQNTTYRIEPGGDSDRFVIIDGNQLSMVSVDADQTTYIITITATGDSAFGNGDNRRTITVTLVGDPHA
ncbi:MAG: BspA family leucine-rich repeat surface protein, partial [Cenarchaeum sp. SB0663_bin_5]|nr:BspA family leucine-rich repeat surface protein [Cenarchaeum sp. SB0663_bin_5]